MALCRGCRCQIDREAPFCDVCGRPRRLAGAAVDLVLADGRRVTVAGELTLGRAPGSSVRLRHASVSRSHARVGRDESGLWLEDLGSRYGTYVDGRRAVGRTRLRDGAQLRLGAVGLRLERRREEQEAGRTVIVRPAVTRGLPGAGPALGTRPRLRAGVSLKRLAASEGDRRYVLRDARGERLLRLAAVEAGLVAELDGSRQLVELLERAERTAGVQGTARLLRLLAELRERGFLTDGGTDARTPGGRLARLLRPRYLASGRFGAPIAVLYRRAGFLAFTRPGLVLLGAVAAAGPAAFVLLAQRGTTALQVAGSAPAGAAVFIAGRLALAAAHELSHALAMASFGRRISRAGLKWVLAFPYAFVDTTDAWLEPRRRRLQVTAAGPICDLVAAGAISLAALACSAGIARETLFQFALGGYIGSVYNLNPLLDRDGYGLLVDALREPGLRPRALAAARARLSGRPARVAERRAVRVYGLAALAWMVLGLGFGAVVAAQRLAALWPSARLAPFVAAGLVVVLAAVLVRRLHRKETSHAV